MRTIIIIIYLTFFLKIHTTFATTYYVSNNGSDLNTGMSSSNPIQTISKANTIGFTAGDSLLFRKGDRFKGQLEIYNSGNSSSYIYIGSYGNGELPEIIGGDTLQNWTIHNNAIYKTHLSANIGLLSYDGQQQMLARHPNSDWFYLNVGIPNNNVIDTTRMGDPDWTGAKLLVMFNDWSLSPFDVQSFDNATGIFQLNANVNTNTNTGVEYCIVDHIEALDSPGEWYQDPITDSIYLWPLDNQDPSAHEILGAVYDHGIYIYGNYVKVEGLDVHCYNHSGIRFNNRHHVLIESNRVSNIKKHGIYSLFGYANKIIGNTIENIGHFGIVGYDSPKGIIELNEISHIGLYQNISEEGLQSSKGTGIRYTGDSLRILKNIIEYIGYNGIHFKGAACEVKNNSIRYYSKTTWDSGAIYCWNEHFDSIGAAGSVISNNIIIGGIDSNTTTFPDSRKSFGIYTDDRIHNVLVEDNFVAFTYAGIFVHNNRFITVRGNELYNNWQNDIRLTTDILVSKGDMYGNQIEQNKMFRLDTNYHNLGLKCRWNIWELASYNDNQYFNPWRDSMIDFTYRPDDINPVYFTYSLNNWNSFSGQDSLSLSNPFHWSIGVDYSMFVTNESDSQKTIPLQGSWMDFDSTIYIGSIDMAPFDGKVLWQFEDCNNEIGGTAFIDSCNICAGGTTGQVPILDPSLCILSAKKVKTPDFKIYPNPSRSTITIRCTRSMINQVYIYSTDGHLIYQLETSPSYIIETDVSALPSSCYFIRIQTEESNHFTSFIKI